MYQGMLRRSLTHPESCQVRKVANLLAQALSWRDEVLLGALNRLARVVNVPTLMDDYDVLLTVVACTAADGRGTRAQVTTAGSHAVAWRMTFGTQTVGFLKIAIFGLRAIEHPPRAVALPTEMIAVHASCPSLRTASTHS